MLAALLFACAATGAIDASIADELSRLTGHDVTIAANGASYVIADVAGEGKPIVGVVQRRGEELWLIAEGGDEYRLTGVLAKPRIAGPGYKIWALGEVNRGGELRARRLGVLARPGGAGVTVPNPRIAPPETEPNPTK